HIAWHRALFYLDTENPDAALAVYDAQIAKLRGADMSSLADASALLWRLRLRNVSVGDRWHFVADGWEKHSLPGARPFYIVHAMMAFAAAGRGPAAQRLMELLSQSDARDLPSSVPEEALVLPFCRALLSFVRREYTACVDWLIRVRHIAHRCGGSL